MIEQIQEFNNHIAKFKDIFAKYIAEKSIPLDERWNAFVLAEHELKNHNTYVTTFKSLPEDFIMDDGPIQMERHETMDAVSLVERVEGVMEDNQDEYSEEALNAVTIISLKEELLALNLGSFTYDW